VNYLTFALLLASLILLPGCSQQSSVQPIGGGGGAGGGGGGGVPRALPRTQAGVPVVRVMVAEAQTTVRLAASADPNLTTATDPRPARLAITGQPVLITLAPTGNWLLNTTPVGAGVLTITPALNTDGTLALGNTTYRGTLRFVPTGGGKFDVVNDVDIDGYLKSVVSKELLRDWHPEAYRAQSVVARTYALYEAATRAPNRHFDMFDDERSQVYGGVNAETSLSRYGVDTTRGIVMTYNDRIFKAYFSSCCGGIGQSAADAFRDPDMPPLMEKNAGTLCSQSPRYTWGPVTLAKTELTRRMRLWASRRDRPEQAMAELRTIAPMAVNRLGRPVRYLVTDAAGQRYMLLAEELRSAINAGGQGRTAWSGFINVRDDGASLTFSGRGSGHGVGMCQYCCQAMALQGRRHEDIVRLSYPGARLVRAY
jgi:stage II sporulation protein D